MVPQKRFKLILLAVTLATAGVYAVAFVLSTTDDRVDQIDTQVVRAAATAACIDLRTAVDAQPALPAGATEKQRETRTQEQAVLVRQFSDQVRAAGDEALDADVPTRQYLADWEALAASRVAYARGGFAGTYAVPVANGEPITMRMDRIGVSACAVPQGLTVAP